MTSPSASLRGSLRVLALAATASLVISLGLCASAHAGAYTVTGTCSAWSPWGTTSGQVAVFAACPALVERNVLGNFTTPAGVGGGWRFDAPAGTAISSVTLNGTMQGLNGWQAAIYTEGPNSHTLDGCPGSSCPGAAKALNNFPYDAQSASAITTRVRCGSSGGCANTA